jgi:hypothetical protein
LDIITAILDISDQEPFHTRASERIALAKEIEMSVKQQTRSPLPPFTLVTAKEKVRLAEDGWSQAIAFPLQENQEAIMTIQFPRKDVAASRLLKSGSSLVRRVVQAQDDPAKQRIREWLIALDNEQLSSRLGLTSEDIAVLRGTQTLPNHLNRSA